MTNIHTYILKLGNSKITVMYVKNMAAPVGWLSDPIIMLLKCIYGY